MARPPECVAYVAKTHWVVGLVITASIVVLHLLTRNLPGVEIGDRAYHITMALAGVYLLSGTLVWVGAPLGRLCSRVCGLLYLVRPNFGSPIWETMNTPEFKAHFAKPETGDRKPES